jgi:hypothetical protein
VWFVQGLWPSLILCQRPFRTVYAPSSGTIPGGGGNDFGGNLNDFGGNLGGGNDFGGNQSGGNDFGGNQNAWEVEMTLAARRSSSGRRARGVPSPLSLEAG